MPRKTPILLREAAFSKHINALTRYSFDGKILKASEKYNVSHDFAHLALQRVCGDHMDIATTLAKTAAGDDLTDDERKQIARIQEGIEDLIAMADPENDPLVTVEAHS